MKSRVILLQVSVLLVVIAGMGCQSSPRAAAAAPQAAATTMDPLDAAYGADLERQTEVQLVEQMARYRKNYMDHLKLLIEFYDRQGNQLKATWAEEELKHMKEGPQRPYLVVAEIAGPDLRATKSILEADLLYREGMKYYKEGRGVIGKFFPDKKKLYLAIDKFNELITNYPESNMIDDAAFQIGQIYHHYLNDYTSALLYYQRVWQWSTESTLPVRFEVARIYDDNLHNWPKAIQYYEQAINLESSYTENVVYAKNRIREINKELAKQ